MTNISPLWRATLAAYICILLLSANGVFSRVIAMSALDITFHRSWIAVIFLSLIVIWNEKSLLLNKWQELPLMLITGWLLIIHWVSFFFAMQVAGVAIGMIALYSYPLMLALLEPLFAKTRLDRTDLLSTMLVLAGIYLLVPELEWHNQSVQGISWGLLSALTFALRNLIQKYSFSHYSAIRSLNLQIIAGILPLYPLHQTIFPAVFTPVSLTNDTWLLLALGIGFTAIPHSLLAYSLKTLKAKTVGLVGCMQPVFAVILAYILLDETPDMITITGGAIILSAAIAETLHVHRKA